MRPKIKISNTSSAGYSQIFKLENFLLLRVFPAVLIFSLWTTFWVLISTKLHVKVAFPPVIITALSIVIGMLLVFRTNGSNERYSEGCKLWENLIGSLKSIAEKIVFHVNPETLEQRNQQIGALNLVLAHAVATKHFLRNETGVDYKDLYPLIKHVPALQRTSVLHKKAPKTKAPPAFGDTPLTIDTRNAVFATASRNAIKKRIRKQYGQSISYFAFNNLPRRISLYLARYIEDAHSQGILEGCDKTSLMGSVNTIVDYVNQLQRILRNPIPVAYSISLKRILVIFSLLFPFQIINDIKYWTIPVTAVVVFVLFSVEMIGLEIENPFGYDDNDLPIDELCEELRIEIVDLICEDPENFVIDSWTGTAIMSDTIYTSERSSKVSRNWAKAVSPIAIVNHLKSSVLFSKKAKTENLTPVSMSRQSSFNKPTIVLDAQTLHVYLSRETPTTASHSAVDTAPSLDSKSNAQIVSLAGAAAIGSGIMASSETL